MRQLIVFKALAEESLETCLTHGLSRAARRYDRTSQQPRRVQHGQRRILRRLPHLDFIQTRAGQQRKPAGDVHGHVLRGWIDRLKRRQLIQMPIVHRPDQYIDEPEKTKAGLREAYRGLLDLDIDLLLLAHGRPVSSGASDALSRFVEAG